MNRDVFGFVLRICALGAAIGAIGVGIGLIYDAVTP